jgi:hypothetical protein
VKTWARVCQQVATLMTPEKPTNLSPSVAAFFENFKTLQHSPQTPERKATREKPISSIECLPRNGEAKKDSEEKFTYYKY